MSEAVTVTSELYAANIPAECALETIEQHEEILLCWALIDRLKRGRSLEGLCTFCDSSKLSREIMRGG